MKNFLLIFVFVLLSCQGQPDYLNFKFIEYSESQDIYKQKGLNEPYSGPVFNIVHDLELIGYGEIKEGKLDGTIKYIDENLWNDKFSDYLSLSSISSAELLENLPGSAQSPDSSYVLAEEFYLNGLPTGNWKVWNKQGRWFRGELSKETRFLNGLQEGESIDYNFSIGRYSTGISKSNWSQGKLDGLQVVINRDDCIMAEINYIDGVLHGDYRTYNCVYEMLSQKKTDQKPLIIASYINGKLDGSYEEYDDKSKIQIKANYVNGIKESYTKYEYWRNGNLMFEKPYDSNNEYDGIFKSYHSNGTLEDEKSYKNGKMDGYFNSYNENGLLEYKRMYKDDIQEGLQIKYWSTDSYISSKIYNIVQAETNFKNGERYGAFKIIDIEDGGLSILEGNYNAKGMHGKASIYDCEVTVIDGRMACDEDTKIKTSNAYYNNDVIEKIEDLDKNGNITKTYNY